MCVVQSIRSGDCVCSSDNQIRRVCVLFRQSDQEIVCVVQTIRSGDCVCSSDNQIRRLCV